MIEALFCPSYVSADDSRIKCEYVQEKQYYSSEHDSEKMFVLFKEGYYKAFKQDYPFNIESTSVIRAKGIGDSVNPEFVQMGANYDKFRASFLKHGGLSLPQECKNEFEWMANMLSALPLRESLVQYSKIDNMIDFLLVLNDGMKLSIGKFTDEDDDKETVDFSLYNKRKLLLSGEIKLDDLVKKIKHIHTTLS